MRNLMIWNAVVAIVLGVVYSVMARVLVGQCGAGRTMVKMLAVVVLTGASTPYVAPALRSVASPLLPKTKMERALESFEARLAAVPEWQERTRGRSRDEILRFAHELGFRGVTRLDDDSLAIASSMLASVLADIHPRTCGRIVKGTLSPAEASAAVLGTFEKADAATLESWMGVLYAAAVAELKGQQGVTASGRDVSGAMQLLLSGMPRTDADLLRRTMLTFKVADDEHACWASRTVYHYLPQLPEPARRDLTRAMFAS
jgi:hypothetical protein